MHKKSLSPKPTLAVLSTAALKSIRGGDGTATPPPRIPKSGDVTLKRG